MLGTMEDVVDLGIVKMLKGPCRFPGEVVCLCRRGSAVGNNLTAESLCAACGHSLSCHADYGQIPLAAAKTRACSIQKYTDIIPRREICRALLKLILQYHVVYVRGTPGSGKSTLIDLLVETIHETVPDLDPVIVGSWNKGTQRWDDYLISQLKSESVLTRSDLLECKNVVFLVDEAQGSYRDELFWNQCIKVVADSSTSVVRPYFVLFASYGSPSSAPVSFPDRSAPVQLAAEQRISLRSTPHCSQTAQLFLTSAEHVELVRKLQENPARRFLAADEVVEYIYKLSNGHVGLTKQLWASLVNHEVLSPYTRDSKEPKMFGLEEAKKFLERERLLFNTIMTSSVSRSLPKTDYISDNAGVADVLRRVAAEGVIEGNIEEDESLRSLYYSGYLHAALQEVGVNEFAFLKTVTCYVPPTTLHLHFYRFLLVSRSLPFPYQAYPTLKHLWKDAVCRISRTRLLSRQFGAGLIPRPLEVKYQDELYRALYKALGHKIMVESEWSGTKGGEQIDFFIPSSRWGIKCLRDSDHLENHIARFFPNGRYWPWIEEQEMSDYVLLNFTSTVPDDIWPEAPFLYHIVYKHEFVSFTVYDNNLVVVPGMDNCALVK